MARLSNDDRLGVGTGPAVASKIITASSPVSKLGTDRDLAASAETTIHARLVDCGSVSYCKYFQ
jgi:hypothetical protein